MARKITNEVLAEKIDALGNKFDTFYNYDYLLLKEEHKNNTEFRQKATGIIAVFMLLGGLVSGIILWILGKVWK